MYNVNILMLVLVLFHITFFKSCLMNDQDSVGNHLPKKWYAANIHCIALKLRLLVMYA